MARYHVNPTTGDPGVCRAEKNCPFGSIDEHYDSREAAAAAYEAKQKLDEHFAHLQKVDETEELVSQLDKLETQRREVEARLDELMTARGGEIDQAMSLRNQIIARKRDFLSSVPLKKMNQKLLVAAIFAESNFTPEANSKLDFAIRLATELHEGTVRKGDVQGRRDTPYVEHPLRNTLRLVRLGVRDEELLSATVLHDTVEDCARKFVASQKSVDARITEAEARQLLLKHIEDNINPRVAKLVLGVTNPLRSSHENRHLSQAQKNEEYAANVQREIESDPAVLLVKFADFEDNAGSLHFSSTEFSPNKIRKLAKKYLPVVGIFREAIAKSELPINDVAHEHILNQLDSMELRLRRIIDATRSVASIKTGD